MLFDLDGTLVDTAPDLVDTLNVVFTGEGGTAVLSPDGPTDDELYELAAMAPHAEGGRLAEGECTRTSVR